jgi:hypothetical protein
MNDEEDKRFGKSANLAAWLKGRGAVAEFATVTADILFSNGYVLPSTLLSVSVEMLQRAGFSDPMAMHLSNKLSKQQSMAFLVSATVRGALQSNGARGNVFQFLEKHLGYFSKEEGIQIMYQGEDLIVKAYFEGKGHACDFQTALNQWEIHKELVNLKGVDIDPVTPVQVQRPSDLERIRLQDYDPKDSESPCHTLDQLHSAFYQFQ